MRLLANEKFGTVNNWIVEKLAEDQPEWETLPDPFNECSAACKKGRRASTTHYIPWHITPASDPFY